MQNQESRLYSLWDIMRNFDAWRLAMLLHHIDTMHRLAKEQCDAGARDEKIMPEIVKEAIEPILHEAEALAKEIELDSTWKRVWHGGGPFFFSATCGITHQQAQHELEVLRQAVEADLDGLTFVFVPPNDAKMLSGMKDTWGAIWEKLPDSHGDVKETIECYTLDRHTASVFHSMRVAEYGLRHLARKLRVKFTHTRKAMPVEFADWEKVITGIKNKIQAIRTNPKLPVGPKRQEQLEKYSDAADHCVYMKDIWRNNISHTRKPYKKTEALNVIERVRDFMQFVTVNFK